MTQLSGSMWVVAAALAALPGTSAALSRLDAAGRCTVNENSSLNPLLTCNDTASILGGGGTWSDPRPGTDSFAAWSASADYGVLRSSSNARGSTFRPNLSPPRLMEVSAGSFAQSRDEITFSAPGLAGQSGVFEGSMRIDGSLSIGTTNTTFGRAFSRWGFGIELLEAGRIVAGQSTGGFLRADFQGTTTSGNPLVNGRIVDFSAPIVFGRTYQMDMVLSTSTDSTVRPQGVPGDPQYLFPVSSSAFANFGSTATWQGIQSMTLANGDPVIGWSVASTSGLDYSQPVPEPATLSLWAGGVLAMGAFALRRRISAAS